ncbi:MAG: ABC transporter ATP-binding protein [Acidobacteria bacterium]|nr:ABC transporter ATP-binding protein [Acidobacteriota bacterium]
MLRVDQLRKSFGELTAVDGIGLEANPGEIYGLLGPNGAGKTTTLSCICGLLTPTSGHIWVNGHDVVRDGVEARRVLGVVPQDLALFEDLSARENLEYWGGAWGMRGQALTQRTTEVLEATGLLDRSKEPVKNFSGGMKRRLNFGCGVVHQPKLLLLDEPTVGVDPQSRVRLLELVREQARNGACVLYTTHYMEEAEALCHRLAIVDHGRIVAQAPLAELRAMAGERDVLRLTGTFSPPAVREALSREDRLEVIQIDETSATLSVADASRRLPAIFSAIHAAGGEIRDTVLRQPTLESLFLKLTGKELRE